MRPVYLEFRMEISGSSQPSAQSAAAAKSASENTASAANISASQTGVTASTQRAESSVVTLSGEALMVSRLYGSQQGVPTTPQTELNKSNSDMTYLDWLTDQDRSTLADMYGYAQQQGADLRYVDRIAFDLGM